jgi:hypothetical protein
MLQTEPRNFFVVRAEHVIGFAFCRHSRSMNAVCEFAHSDFRAAKFSAFMEGDAPGNDKALPLQFAVTRILS